MATHQYIGARYVPTFSEVNGGVWANTYTYEALTIVKHGNDFYTSRKPVPTGVDISNTDYWILTGSYNGAIASLQNEIDDLEEKKLGDWSARKILYIGDSFDVYYPGHSWVNRCNELLGDPPYFNTSFSGAGFTGVIGYSLISKFPDMVIPDESSFTDVVIGLGGNDTPDGSQINLSTIISDIGTFVNYLRARFTGVKRIYLGQLAYKHDTTQKLRNSLDCTRGYKYACNTYGLIYLNGVEDILKYVPLLYGVDGLHPNTSGINSLGEGIAQALKSGSFDINMKPGVYTIDTSAADAGLHFNGDLKVNTSLIKGVYSFYLPAVTITKDSATVLSVGLHTLGSFDVNKLCVPLDVAIGIPVYDRRLLSGTSNPKNDISVIPHMFTSDGKLKAYFGNAGAGSTDLFNELGCPVTFTGDI